LRYFGTSLKDAILQAFDVGRRHSLSCGTHWKREQRGRKDSKASDHCQSPANQA
jgi:hypothetical protein